MSTAEIVVAAVLIVVALIGVVSLRLSDHRKKKEENRQKGIEAYAGARTAWDQAMTDEITLAVRKDKLQEAGRYLVQIKLFVGTHIETAEYAELVRLLENDLLAQGRTSPLARARVLWPQVESQIHVALAP